MPVSSSIIMQLAVLVLCGGIVLFAAYFLPQKITAMLLLVIIPIQIIETKYFSANTIMTYILFFGILLKGEDLRLPLLPQFGLLLLVYMLSMSQVDPDSYVLHGVYIFSLISAFLVFWIAYNLTLQVENPRSIIWVFLAMNVIVAVYCLIQVLVGPGHKFILFGIEEISMLPARPDNRLVGPFGGPGIVAEFFVIMIMLGTNEFLSVSGKWYRLGLVALTAINLIYLVMTGNRGGFLVLLGASIVFLFLFRKELGPVRLIRITAGGILLLAILSAIAIKYTEFDQLFSRLAVTQVEAGVPDTRQESWSAALRAISRNPILGSGPRLDLGDINLGRPFEGHPYIGYPHNLYLFLLATVGVVGLLAFLAFLITPVFRCWRRIREPGGDQYLNSLVKTGMVIMVVIFVDEMKIDFMRFALVDYWHFVFALLGAIVGFCDRECNSDRLEDVAGNAAQKSFALA